MDYSERYKPEHRGIAVGQIPFWQINVLVVPPSMKCLPCTQRSVSTAALESSMIESIFNVLSSTGDRSSNTHGLGTTTTGARLGVTVNWLLTGWELWNLVCTVKHNETDSSNRWSQWSAHCICNRHRNLTRKTSDSILTPDIIVWRSIAHFCNHDHF